MTESPWLTTFDAAQYLRMAPVTIRAACRDGKLRHTQPGGARGKILTTREWCDEWVRRYVQGGE